MNDDNPQLIIRQLGLQTYEPVWQAMVDFTNQRDATTSDELWFLQHQPVFTQGQAGKSEHLLMPGDIPVVQVDRGGQVTYHGPGQLVIYCLLDLKRKKWGVRQLVCAIEKSVMALLANYNIQSHLKDKAPGVYVNNEKICSLGLRIRKGCSFHGLALNVAMDKEPFQRINPCGYAGLKVTQIADITPTNNIDKVNDDLCDILAEQLNYPKSVILERQTFLKGETFEK